MKILSRVLIALVVLFIFGTIYILARSSIESFLLRKIIERLEADSRIAEVVVIDSRYNPQTGKASTTIKFVEYDSKGNALQPRFFSFRDNLIQFMSLVIRFDNYYIKRGDRLKGKSAYLFVKVFCLDDHKTEIYTITSVNEVPEGYKVGSRATLFERKLWRKFWKYALSPDEAKKEGIKVAQVEAPGTRFIPGLIYTIKIEHSGGIKIETKKIPEILKN